MRVKAIQISGAKVINIGNERICIRQRSISIFSLLHQDFCLPPYSSTILGSFLGDTKVLLDNMALKF
jgi:hypothetical protein